MSRFLDTLYVTSNTGLRLADTDGNYYLTIRPGTNLSADHTFTLITPDADCSLTLGASSSISGTAYVVGGTDVAVADGGTGASTAADARTNLGLGTMATQNASAVNIDGGAIDGTQIGATSPEDGHFLDCIANEFIGSVAIPNTGLNVLDTDASHYLRIKPGSNLTALRTLTVVTADADQTLTITGSPSISGTNTGDQTITLTSDVTGSGSGSFATTIAAGAVTYAKMQDVSATQRVIGRNTSGSGDPEEVTLSQLLDWVGSAANGDILKRAGGSWGRLAVGNADQILGVSSSLPAWLTASGRILGTSYVSTSQNTTSTTPVGLTTAQTVSFTLAATSNVLLLCWAACIIDTQYASGRLYIHDGSTDNVASIGTIPVATGAAQLTGPLVQTSLAAGSYTYTLKFSTTSGTASFSARLLMAILL